MPIQVCYSIGIPTPTRKTGMIKNISWPQYHRMLANLTRDITNSGWRPDIIVGLTRGGLIPATMLSHYFEVPMVTLKVALRDSTTKPESNRELPEQITHGTKVLIVDDINDSGATLKWIEQDWSEALFQTTGNHVMQWNDNVRVAVLFDKESSSAADLVSYRAETIFPDDDSWITFPWENWWTA